MKTVKFYSIFANVKKYMGFQALKNTNYLELRSWVLSGNICIIDKNVIENIAQLKPYYKILN